MPAARYDAGDNFPVQFVWKLPDGDYIRAVFQVTVLALIPAADKYMVRLDKLIAGRQETPSGDPRPKEELSTAYWAMVGRLPGRKITIAYEADDGRSLHLRLATLTGEHDFFFRFPD